MAALQFLQDIRHKHRVAPSGDVYKAEQTTNNGLFKSGRTGMFYYWAALPEYARDINGFTHDARPMPRGPGGAFTGGGGKGIAIYAKSRAVDAAWEVLKYLQSKEVMEAEVLEGNSVPSRKSLATLPAWLSATQPPKSRKVLSDAFSYVSVDPLLLNWIEVRAAMQAEVNKLINNEQSPGATAAAIKQAVEPLLEEHARLAGS